MTTHTTTNQVALDQEILAAHNKPKKQQDDFSWDTAMGNPLSLSPGAPALSWANMPEIPEPWELLESPQVWVNGEVIPRNLTYNNTSTPKCDFQSTFSSTNSPLLSENDTFNNFANVDFSLHSFIPTIGSNDRTLSISSQKGPATRNGLDSIGAVYQQPVSPVSHHETYTSDHVETSRQKRANPTKSRSQRHSTEGSDTPSSQDSDEEKVAERRRKNKLAARKLRQKKLDQVSELEAQLEKVKKERNALRLRAAKSEGELMALRQMFDQK